MSMSNFREEKKEKNSSPKFTQPTLDLTSVAAIESKLHIKSDSPKDHLIEPMLPKDKQAELKTLPNFIPDKFKILPVISDPISDEFKVLHIINELLIICSSERATQIDNAEDSSFWSSAKLKAIPDTTERCITENYHPRLKSIEIVTPNTQFLSEKESLPANIVVLTFQEQTILGTREKKYYSFKIDDTAIIQKLFSDMKRLLPSNCFEISSYKPYIVGEGQGFCNDPNDIKSRMCWEIEKGSEEKHWKSIPVHRNVYKGLYSAISQKTEIFFRNIFAENNAIEQANDSQSSGIRRENNTPRVVTIFVMGCATGDDAVTLMLDIQKQLSVARKIHLWLLEPAKNQLKIACEKIEALKKENALLKEVEVFPLCMTMRMLPENKIPHDKLIGQVDIAYSLGGPFNAHVVNRREAMFNLALLQKYIRPHASDIDTCLPGLFICSGYTICLFTTEDLEDHGWRVFNTIAEYAEDELTQCYICEPKQEILSDKKTHYLLESLFSTREHTFTNKDLDRLENMTLQQHMRLEGQTNLSLYYDWGLYTDNRNLVCNQTLSNFLYEPEPYYYSLLNYHPKKLNAPPFIIPLSSCNMDDDRNQELAYSPGSLRGLHLFSPDSLTELQAFWRSPSSGSSSSPELPVRSHTSSTSTSLILSKTSQQEIDLSPYQSVAAKVAITFNLPQQLRMKAVKVLNLIDKINSVQRQDEDVVALKQTFSLLPRLFRRNFLTPATSSISSTSTSFVNPSNLPHPTMRSSGS